MLDVDTQNSNVTVLSGTPSVALICIITLSSPIGPDLSALNVTWQYNKSSAVGTMTLQPVTGSNNMRFMSALTLNKTTGSTYSGQYCCHAGITETTVTSNCTYVTVAGKSSSITFLSYL